MATHRFETVLAAEDGGVFFEVPLDVPVAFGRARAPVRGTINGQPFRSTVAVYGGRYYLPANRALREAAFEGLSFTHQREYARWVAEAKREATRRRRVEQAVQQMLRDGRRHP
jgi:hypothetical protein